MLQQNGSFKGLTITPTKGKDGSYTIKMSAKEWKVFETNSATAGGVIRNSVEIGGVTINVTMDASAFDGFNNNPVSAFS